MTAANRTINQNVILKLQGFLSPTQAVDKLGAGIKLRHHFFVYPSKHRYQPYSVSFQNCDSYFFHIDCLAYFDFPYISVSKLYINSLQISTYRKDGFVSRYFY